MNYHKSAYIKYLVDMRWNIITLLYNNIDLNTSLFLQPKFEENTVHNYYAYQINKLKKTRIGNEESKIQRHRQHGAQYTGR